MAGLFLRFKLIRHVFQTWTELTRQAWHREALFVIEVKEINKHLKRSTEAGLHVRQDAGNTSGGNYLLNHKETAHSIFVRSGGISSQTGSWWKSIKGQPVMFQLHQLLSWQETTWGSFYSKTTTKQCSWNMRAAEDCLSLLSVWTQQIMWQLQIFPPPPLSATVFRDKLRSWCVQWNGIVETTNEAEQAYFRGCRCHSTCVHLELNNNANKVPKNCSSSNVQKRKSTTHF